MPALQNITENPGTPWSTDMPVPEDGAEVTADANDGMTQGPVNIAFQQLLDRDACLALGTVSVFSVYADGTGEQAVFAPGAAGLIHSTEDITAGTEIEAGTLLRAKEHGTMEANGARVKWTSVGNTANDGNPPRNTGLTNDLRPLTACKAWGRVTTDGANGFTILDGANILGASFAAYGGGHIFEVTLAANMADANYGCVASCFGSGGPVGICMIGAMDATNPPTTSTFALYFDGDPTTTIYDFSFELKGRQ